MAMCGSPSIARGWRSWLPRLVAASLLVVVLAAGCRTAIAPDAARLAALEPELGSLLLVGIDGIDGEATDVDGLLCGARVGGTVLFARNIVAPEQLARLTAALAERAAICTGLKLFVAVDAEGGSVMRLAPSVGWPGTLSAQELGEANDFVLTELEARRIGRMLRAAGINWDLAPVVDVGYNPANPVIGATARGSRRNTRAARALVLGMRAEGVLTALKHFPGHGSSYGDSHRGFTDVTDTASPEVELLPYRTLIDAGLADSVMTAHVFNRRLDERRPATLSRATISGLLRGELGFAGPVVSDDLRMAAIEQQYGLGEAAVLAIDAGVDMLLIVDNRLPDGGSAALVTLGAIRDALASGTLDPARVEAALARIRAFRGRLP